MPPLPEFHLKGVKCGGLSDLYYVSAVVIKQFIDEKEKAIPVSFEQHEKELKEALTTLITLTSDSGLYSAANKHLSNALSLSTLSTQERNEFLFRGLLLTPTVFESIDQLVQTRQKLDIYLSALQNSMRREKLSLKELNEFVLSPTFYYIYYGFNDKDLLSSLFSFYSIAFPSISNYSDLSLAIQQSKKYREDQQLQQGLNQPKQRIRIGFVSNYFRRHSICKLFCNIVVGLSESDQFDVFIFSSLQENHEDQTTQNIRKISNRSNSHLKFISVGKTLIYNRNEVTDRRIDILVRFFCFESRTLLL
jgi:predicted O-linked N-acetylglucosamine transferase (SPINDLY family)